ncbi:F-box protein At2g02240-like isoform X2 [Phoenix dactylifera]|uniref:F-box protein At2g02240-like isoform X2 n=1 Tax=Phoenix dactylifera TaxID=42345 RepID=A0A8B7BT30_PHODC|nr:F-box protein At2g02240-like isoform X2 [Phoenix dactylifera]
MAPVSSSSGTDVEKSDAVGLALCPRNLFIPWAKDARCWTWDRIPLESQDYRQIDVPELLKVAWLDVRGNFNMSQLTAMTWYEVVMEVKLKEPCQGWALPVTLEICKADGTSTSSQVTLDSMPRNQWHNLVVGNFEATGPREVQFSLKETTWGNWKKGLLIKRVLVRPANPGYGVKGLVIYPEDMWISWGRDARYWKWNCLLFDSQDYGEIEVPKLLGVSWLEIRGSFEISKLKAGAAYEVVIVAMLKEPCSGWESPLTLHLLRPDSTSASREVTLKGMASNRWLDLVVGDFLAAGSGLVEFSMTETKVGNWKKGLIIKHALIRPVHD